MNGTIKVAIDAKELAKKNIGSLGMILLELMPRMETCELLLLSDIEVPTEYIPEGARVVIRGVKYSGGADLFKYQLWMKKQCEENAVDWFYQINHFTLFKIRGTKQIAVIHDLYPLENLEKTSIKLKVTYWISIFLTLVNADVIFTVSEFTKSRLAHFFWKSKKVQVNYNGIAPLQKSKSENIVDGKFFLMLGRVSYWKGTFQVAEIFSKHFANSEYKLIIAGQAQNEEDAQKMRSITSSCDNIVWMDYVDNSTRDWLLQNADLFLYASRYDGFGKPPLEAALAHTPVLINDIPVLREVTKNKGNYVDFYGSQEEIYNAISNMEKNQDEEKLKQLQEIAQSYTWDDFANKTIAVVQSVRGE
jgi:glycosyltransferase involved in cell wall biosynthesis